MVDFGFWLWPVKAYNLMSIMALKRVALRGLLALPYHPAWTVFG